MKTLPLYQKIARLVQAIENCKESGNDVWLDKHTDRLEKLVQTRLPSGSGFDSGTDFYVEKSTPNKLVFTTSFHHMNDVGMYDGWTHHEIVVKPSLGFGFELTVKGRNRNDIKDYIHETFEYCLGEEINEEF